MAGKKGRSGRKPKPVAVHLLNGTYRPSRHGPYPVPIQGVPVPMPEWLPNMADREGLSARARQLLEDLLTVYRFDAIEGPRLLSAIRSFSRLDQLEAAVTVGGVMCDGAATPLLVALGRETRTFQALWSALHLGGWEAPRHGDVA